MDESRCTSAASTPTLRRSPRTVAERVLLIDAQLRAIKPPQRRAATEMQWMYLLASSLDEPHRYIEGAKNVQVNLGTVSALIFSVTIGSVLEPFSNEKSESDA